MRYAGGEARLRTGRTGMMDGAMAWATAGSMAISVREQGAARRVTLDGALDVTTVTVAARDLAALPVDRPLELDLSHLDRIDTAGAWALCRLRARGEAAGQEVTIIGADSNAESVIRTVQAAMPAPDDHPAPPPSLADRLEAVGRGTVRAGAFFVELCAYLGLFLVRFARSIVVPRDFRLTALVHHCHEVGIKAVPIVALMAFLIGIVLAFQGAVQLRQFGAEIFVVELISVSILRELGILLTAIIVAGRTASAFTAAIGSMKMREEIDAMRTLGIDPATALFVPRILALVIMLPILGMIANVVGILGGALMAWVELGVSPAMFRTRLLEGVMFSNLLVGMIKAPIFAIVIGVVGCHAGMQVGGNAESLGRMTSASVVTAIFSVIVIDAMFSVFFAQAGM